MEVVNVRTIGGVDGAQSKGVVYCGRPSPLGNPYEIGAHGTRDEVIQRYRRWLWDAIQDYRTVLACPGHTPREKRQIVAVETLMSLSEDASLGCWCKPLACHCDVIVAAWQWMKRQGMLAS